MDLFLELYLGHLIGDFLLQPGRLVVAKRDGAPGLVLHTLIVGAATMAVLAGTMTADWAVAALVTGAHLVIERLTIATYVGTRTRGLFTFLLDQALHLLSIALIVWAAGRWQLSPDAMVFGIALSTVGLAKVCALATVSLLGSILVFESVNAILGSDKGGLLGLDGARIWGVVERGGALALALASPALLILPFVPRLVYAATRPDGDKARPVVEACAGIVLTIAGYLSIAAVSYLVSGSISALALSAGFR